MKLEIEIERAGFQLRPAVRRRGTAPRDADSTTDRVAEEAPVALVVNGICLLYTSDAADE